MDLCYDVAMPKSHIKKKQKLINKPKVIAKDSDQAIQPSIAKGRSTDGVKPVQGSGKIKLSAKAEHDKVYIDQRLHYVTREIKRSLMMVMIVGVIYLAIYFVLEKTDLGGQAIEFFTL